MNTARSKPPFTVLIIVLASLISTSLSALIQENFNTAPDPEKWIHNGVTTWVPEYQALFLTDAAADQIGSVFWWEPLRADVFSVSFDLWIGDGSGADGMTFAWVRGPELLGGGGGSLGFYGLDGYAIKFDTYSGGDPEPENYVAIVEGSQSSSSTGFAYDATIPDLEDAFDATGNYPAPYHVDIEFSNGRVEMWMENQTSAPSMSRTKVFDFTIPGYVAFDAYFGFTAATGGADNIHAIDSIVIQKGADAGSDQRVDSGTTVTLSGSGFADATSFKWTQIGGMEDLTVTFVPNPNQAQVTFTTPTVEIGYVLTFELAVTSPTKGTAIDTCRVAVLANNPPKVPPSNFRISPLDRGTLGLGFNLRWDPVLDADQYQVAIKAGEDYLWLETIVETSYQVLGLTEGQPRILAVRGENKHSDLGSLDPADHGVQSEDISYFGMRNLALPTALGGIYEPSQPVYVVSHYPITGMNNAKYDDNNDSWNGLWKDDDYWGYLWATPKFFDHIVYFTGNMFANGGWFLNLKMQYTQDGITWADAPIVDVYPACDFSDQRGGKLPFTRYDIQIPTLRGTGIRIAGTPGGTATFSSISELEVFGLQTQGPLIVQGVDAEYNEGATASLDGSFTFSTAGPITSYQWTGPGGITITNPTSAVASFEAPNVTEDTVYVFSLEASDGTNTDADDDVRVLVKNVVTTAVAGPDQSVEEGQQATLDGSGSLTTTGNITYLWTQTGGTDVGVTGQTTATVSFTAPIIWDYEEDLTFKLDVNDGAGGTSSDVVVVTVRNALAWPAYPVTYPSTTSYLQNMLHLGTNSTDRLTNPENWGNMVSGFDPLESFGGVRTIRPYPGLAFDFTGLAPTPSRNPMVWSPVFSSSGIFDNTPLDYFQMHYSVYILSPEDRDVRWHVRNDDEVRVFCNGTTVLSRDSWDVNVEQVENGLVADGKGLKKGLNSITGWYEEGEGGAIIAIGITDLSDQRFDDLLYSLGPSLILTDAYASRSLPMSYGPGDTINIELAMKVNPTSTPSSVTISENIPAGIPPENFKGPGIPPLPVINGGKITWTLPTPNVKNQTLTYSLTVPMEGVTDVLDFEGTLTFGTTVADIFGDNVVYPEPLAPRSVTVEMLQAAHLSWSAPLTYGTTSYNVYRSINGGAYELTASTTSTSYTDKWVTAGNNYAYEVSAVNILNQEGPLSRPTAQVSVAAMAVRESEDFNCNGQPYTPGCTANEAPSYGDRDPQYDFWHPNTGGPNAYRPQNPTPDGIGIETVEEVDNPGVFHTNIGWVDVSSWYRYTYNVPQAGWIKLEFRVAAPSSGSLAAYWDETLIGTVSYNTGNWHIFNWYLMEDQIQTTAGVHTLRIESIAGGVNFDKHAISWNAAPPTRASIWADDFESYTTTADVFSPTNGGWTRGNTTGSAGSWTLWDTSTNLGSESGDIPAMEGNYMVADSDLSGAGTLLDEEMLSPEVDCDGWTKLRLNYNYNYRIYDDPDHTQDAEVDVRVFDSATGWSGWTNLFHLDTSDVPPALDPPMLSGTQVYDLSVYDGKKIQLKFHFFNAEYDYWFAFDNVAVTGVQEAVEIPLPDIALAAGNVTVSWDAFAGQYTVEYTADLKGTWTPIAGPITLTSFTEVMRADRTGYYRIVGQ